MRIENSFWGLVLSGLLFCLLMSQVSGAEKELIELKVVEKVELNRYLGKWYEIASIPAPFQKQCAYGVTATYSMGKEGMIEVLNQCWTKEGKLKSAKGRAWVVDEKSNAKLKVSFVPLVNWNFLAGDYWVIDLGKNYEYAVVGHPTRKYGWILAREPKIDKSALDKIIQRLAEQGYDFSKFRLTEHKPSSSEK